MTTNKLYQAVFDPRSIALIGASSDEKKNTSRPQRYLKRHGYQGKIIPVNPGREEVFGEKAYSDVASIPSEVDHAFVMVPAKAVPAALKQCVEKKIPVVTVYSDGFAETGEAGRAKQQELNDIIRGSQHAPGRPQLHWPAQHPDPPRAVSECSAGETRHHPRRAGDRVAVRQHDGRPDVARTGPWCRFLETDFSRQ